MKWISVKDRLPALNEKVLVFDENLPNRKYHRNITVAYYMNICCFNCKKKEILDEKTQSYYYEPRVCDHTNTVWTCNFTDKTVHPSHWAPFINTPMHVHCKDCGSSDCGQMKGDK